MSEDRNVLRRKFYKCGYEIRDEFVTLNSMGVYVRSAYTVNGDYIGDEKTAKFLVGDKGIAPQLRTPTSRTCSIGYSAKDGKWYGWSHRAIKGFKVCAVCKVDEAKRLACEFAESVS